MQGMTLLRQETSFNTINFTEKRLFVCARDRIFVHVANTRDPNAREISVRDLERGFVIGATVINEHIRDYVARFGIDESTQWWSESNHQWAYQEEIDARDTKTKVFLKKESRVYFILNTERNTLKIGWTRSVDRRFRHIQTASSDKLELLGHIEGDKATEAQFHEQFAVHRCNGEWFDYVDEVRGTVEKLLNP